MGENIQVPNSETVYSWTPINSLGQVERSSVKQKRELQKAQHSSSRPLKQNGVRGTVPSPGNTRVLCGRTDTGHPVTRWDDTEKCKKVVTQWAHWCLLTPHIAEPSSVRASKIGTI